MAASAAQLNKTAPGIVGKRSIDIVLRGYVQAGETTKALFVFVDAPHFFARLQNFGDGAKIEVAAATRLCPLDTTILQKIGRLQITLAVGRSAEHVPTPVAKANQHLGGNGLSFVLSEIEHSITLA